MNKFAPAKYLTTEEKNKILKIQTDLIAAETREEVLEHEKKIAVFLRLALTRYRKEFGTGKEENRELISS